MCNQLKPYTHTLSNTYTHTHKVKCIIIEFIDLKTKRTWEWWREGKWRGKINDAIKWII